MGQRRAQCTPKPDCAVPPGFAAHPSRPPPAPPPPLPPSPGNLEDITLRALRVLRGASLVLAEDTRHTRALLSHFGIRASLHSFHQHNERHKQALVRLSLGEQRGGAVAVAVLACVEALPCACSPSLALAAAKPLLHVLPSPAAALPHPPTHLPQVLRQLQQGAAIALVSDAGTPAINDPGADLVAAAAAAGLPVIPVPGPSAVLAALVASGLPTAQFLYCGFTAPKSGARRKQLTPLAGQPATLIFFVSPHSLVAALADAAAVLGGQRRRAEPCMGVLACC